MDLEIFFLIVACLLLFLDIALKSTTKLTSKRKRDYAIFAGVFAFALIIASYAILLQAFMNNDFSFIGVYSYSSSSTSLLSIVYSSWAGAGGSMLFLTVLLSIFYLGLRLLVSEGPTGST